jgi:hypothetical protein
MTFQPYVHNSWQHYQKLARQVWAFASHHGLRQRISFVESWYFPSRTCLVELWREKKALL